MSTKDILKGLYASDNFIEDLAKHIKNHCNFVIQADKKLLNMIEKKIKSNTIYDDADIRDVFQQLHGYWTFGDLWVLDHFGIIKLILLNATDIDEDEVIEQSRRFDLNRYLNNTVEQCSRRYYKLALTQDKNSI